MVFSLKGAKGIYSCPEVNLPDDDDELKEKPLAAQTVLDVYKARRPRIIWKTSLSA